MSYNPFKRSRKSKPGEDDTVLQSIPFRDENGDYAEFLVRRPRDAEESYGSLEEFKKMMEG
jgi:hypothetical protein